MGQTCKTCSHPKLAEIDRAILAGEPKRRIAARCDVSETALRRHAAHVSETVALAVKAEEETRADDLLAILHEGVRDARRLRDKAEKQDDVRGAIGAVKVLCEIVEKLASVAEKLATAESKGPRTIRLQWLDEPEAGPIEPRTFAREAASRPASPPAAPAPEPEPRRVQTARSLPGCDPGADRCEELPWNPAGLPIRRSDGGRSL